MTSERSAICIYLTDRCAYGSLAPKIDAPERGVYLKWLAYAGSVLDPALVMHRAGLDAPFATWNALPAVVDELADALRGKSRLLGEWFTAADVMLGSIIAMATFNKQLPASEVLKSYNHRVMARPACARAVARTWPPSVFGKT